LPRVQELFEARVPKAKSPIASVDGKIKIEDDDAFFTLTIIPDDGSEEAVYEKLSKRQGLSPLGTGGVERPLRDGAHVQMGQHLINEVQKVYRDQGVAIHDKHIEIIVRQMLRRVTVIDSGSTEYLPGSLVDHSDAVAASKEAVKTGGRPVEVRAEIMGITKASL